MIIKFSFALVMVIIVTGLVFLSLWDFPPPASPTEQAIDKMTVLQ